MMVRAMGAMGRGRGTVRAGGVIECFDFGAGAVGGERREMWKGEGI